MLGGDLQEAALPHQQGQQQLGRMATGGGNAEAAGGDAVLKFDNIYLCVKDKLSVGILKMTEKGVAWKSKQTGKVTSVPKAELKDVHWLRVCKGFEMKLVLANGDFVRFDGFSTGDLDKLEEYCKRQFDIDIKKIEMSVKGWNWGNVDLAGSQLAFTVEDKKLFEFPVGDIMQPTLTGKNELAIELNQQDNDNADHDLVEVRFWLPEDAPEENTTTEAGADGEEAEAEEKEPKDSKIQVLHKKLLSLTETAISGEAIAAFPDMPCVTPRGRYEVEMYATFMRLHGKTYDYKIMYTSVLRLFLLPKSDQRYVYFVISLDPPIRQGQTRYPFLIFQFPTDDEIEMELNVTEEEIEKTYQNKLAAKMNGPTYEIMSRVFKALTNRKITIPGTFKSHSDSTAVKCSLKANDGYLFPLEKGFMFVHKPCIHIRFDEIANVSFARVGATSTGTSRTFDIDVELNNGTKHSFTGIQREEYSKLYSFMATKKLRIKNVKSQEGVSMRDDDFDSSGSEEEGYVQGGLDDDDDEDDEDFKVNLDAESDISEEYDSNPSSDEGSGSDSESGSGSGGSGDEDEDDEDVLGSSDDEEEEKPKGKKRKAPAPGKKKEKEEGSAKKKAKRKKKPQDPNAPKKPLTSYIIYCNENRAKVKEANPKLSQTELMKKLSEGWKAISEEEKAKYVAKSESAKKDRFSSRMCCHGSQTKYSQKQGLFAEEMRNYNDNVHMYFENGSEYDVAYGSINESSGEN
eukprot:Nk52_evm3s96 gene=Nk52_evmTU3s96